MNWIFLSPHPCTLEEATLLGQCDFHFTRRGGPGGQHRNKVSSAVVVTHRPTQILAEANERRDQSQNRRVAVARLRRQLAWLVRQPVPTTAPATDLAQQTDVVRHTAAGPNSAAVPDDRAAPSQRPAAVSDLWRVRCIEQPAKVSPEHWDYPTLLAEALDQLHAHQGQVSSAAAALQISTARLVKLFKIDRPSWEWINRYRASLGLPQLH
jgi:hypothetical protein